VALGLGSVGGRVGVGDNGSTAARVGVGTAEALGPLKAPTTRIPPESSAVATRAAVTALALGPG
jgi:hypothetical protein